ncbi:MAG: aspartyl/asparaginyl beta-hydroxylase domain-containing protein [Nevskia sp.]|nr:aspartyl/asparaginyl beta-hydroxylase domain-containing protein [Nevskia sp.]
MGGDPADAQGRLGAVLQEAREHERSGRAALSERAYLRALEIDPAAVEALNAVAMAALSRGQAQRAFGLLQQAERCDKENPLTQHNLGLALSATGQLQAAGKALERAVAVEPGFAIAQLHLGRVREQLGDAHGALASYARALALAHAENHWVDEASTPRGLLSLVRHAATTVVRGRRRWLAEALQPLRAHYGAAAFPRVDKCVDMYLGERETAYPDPRQKPRFLYFPDLPAMPYFDTALFPWLADLERSAGEIRAELEQAMARRSGFQPFLELSENANVLDYLRAPDNRPTWDALFFYRHGERFEQNHEDCPRTAAALHKLPLVRIREHAPEICFSLLTPGTHILPHRGVTNTRVVAHLPLIVPPGCALNVGGIEHQWQEGRCVVFDDTFEHEAWNRGQGDRLVLIFDLWNPYLTDPEREAVTALVAAIGDLNRLCGK